MAQIYQPAEDSYLLSKTLSKYLKKDKSKKILDMGSGSGIQAKTLMQSGINPKNLTLVDINKTAINNLKKNFPKSKIIYSDLFQNIRGKFDLIIFNPPYLSEHKFDKEKDTSGGKKGNEVIIKFLQQAKSYLKENAKIFLLTSSLTPKIDFKKLGYKEKQVAHENLFMEQLYVWKLSKV